MSTVDRRRRLEGRSQVEILMQPATPASAAFTSRDARRQAHYRQEVNAFCEAGRWLVVRNDFESFCVAPSSCQLVTRRAGATCIIRLTSLSSGGGFHHRCCCFVAAHWANNGGSISIMAGDGKKPVCGCVVRGDGAIKHSCVLLLQR